ncbi:oligosaccharide flippase family protein [Pararhizobium sp. YC-54]|uniref:lipopolysaccharide biosynthesis protein n=1 Tax=Pararhizobium sp. YC-54 TaxID=2986920 RepID=UPI0021F7F00A|nr:oligosaccharide flippase family protein [Pararhizobium sp. YC-54]MCV9999536.1 oligosaccharide flippase family protein [Pararhizobium sp. YC-54]
MSLPGSLLLRLGKVRSSLKKETHFLVRLKNIAHLLTGNFASSFIGLAGFALTARALGPADYGVLAICFAYTRGIERLVSFRSWQPLVKYGAEALQTEDLSNLKTLFKFGLLLDVVAAGIAWTVAVLVVVFAGPLIGVSAEMSRIVLIYCSVLLFQLSGMSTAVLRLYGRYNVLAYGQVLASIVRVAFSLFGVLAGWGLFEFLVLWMAAQILGSLNMNLLAFIELRKQGMGGVLLAPVRGIAKQFPGLYSFSFSSNLSSAIRSSANELDTLIVGYLTDPAAAGLYHIAKRIGRIAQQAGVQVQAVLFPDLARAWSANRVKDFRRIVFQTQMLLFVFGVAALLFFYLTINRVLLWTAGPEFLGAGPLVIVQTIAVMMTLCGTVLYSALLAMGKEALVLRIVFAAAIVFHITAFTLVPQVGPMGANIAHICMSFVLLSGMTYIYRRNSPKI